MISKEMRLLAAKWQKGEGWPKFLRAVEPDGLRGWKGQRIEFEFPIVAIVGENGAGKSTIIQAAASAYRAKPATRPYYPSEFFPDTPWEQITKASIKSFVMEGKISRDNTVSKETLRWRGLTRRRERDVLYIDLSRIQPVAARTGFSRLAKASHKLSSEVSFDEQKLQTLSEIMGKNYEAASMSTTDFDVHRAVPVTKHKNVSYSGFHGGAGETTMVEFLVTNFPKHCLVVIDEIETSLHPRSQRRLMRYLADTCRLNGVQVILSTHSPFILSELPPQARLYAMEGDSGREIIKGISPEFAMTQMDMEQHPECDVYVEDDVAVALVRETLSLHSKDAARRCAVLPYGAANVGQSLGQMVKGSRFSRPTCVFLDGDQAEGDGYSLLPGGDAPERVVFEALAAAKWPDVSERVSRPHSQVVDALESSLSISDHHEWVSNAGDKLLLGGSFLWQVLSSVWATKVASENEIKAITSPVEDLLT